MHQKRIMPIAIVFVDFGLKLDELRHQAIITIRALLHLFFCPHIYIGCIESCFTVFDLQFVILVLYDIVRLLCGHPQDWHLRSPTQGTLSFPKHTK